MYATFVAKSPGAWSPGRSSNRQTKFLQNLGFRQNGGTAQPAFLFLLVPLWVYGDLSHLIALVGDSGTISAQVKPINAATEKDHVQGSSAFLHIILWGSNEIYHPSLGLTGAGTRTFLRRKLWEFSLLVGMALLVLLVYVGTLLFKLVRHMDFPGTESFSSLVVAYLEPWRLTLFFIAVGGIVMILIQIRSYN